MTLFPPPTKQVLDDNLRRLHGLKPRPTKDERLAKLDRLHVSPAGRAYRFLCIVLRCGAVIRSIG